MYQHLIYLIYCSNCLNYWLVGPVFTLSISDLSKLGFKLAKLNFLAKNDLSIHAAF